MPHYPDARRDVPALPDPGSPLDTGGARMPPADAGTVPALLPLYDSRGRAVVASALVDAEDLARLAGYCWRLHGTPAAPRWVARYQARRERDAQAPKYVSVAQELLGPVGCVTFYNSNRLDFRKANLLTPQARQAACAAGAQALQAATWSGTDTAGAGWERLAVSRGWTMMIDTAWLARVAGYRWVVSRRGRNLYVTHQLRPAQGRSRTLFLTRVIMGLQRLDDGVSVGPGVVTMRTPPDHTTQTFDLRASNLLVTTRGGINLRRPTRRPYRGVHQQGQRYRAHLKFDGHELVLGLYDTPAAAAQARDAALQQLGLATLARMNMGEEHEPCA